MNAISGNTMTLEHFHDFYYLEALQAQINMAKSANPEIAFRHSVERLEADVKEAFEHLTKSMALRIYVYLYAAALGEARHADDFCATYIADLEGKHRSSVYAMSTEYFPSDANTEILRNIYTQKWNSGAFGGKAWLSIVDGMLLYGKISDAAFIDHSVDLEHNGGNVFTKGAKSEINLDCFGGYNAMDLRAFLDYKFAHDILDYNPRYYKWSVSRKVYSMIVRFSNIVRKISAPEYLNGNLEWLSDYSVDWGTKEFTTSETRGGGRGNLMECPMCGENRVDSENHEHVDGNCVCDSCYARHERKYSDCENCGNTVRKDSLTYIDDSQEDWCEKCTQNHAEYCESCQTMNSDTIQTEQGHCYCDSCKDDSAEYCEICEEWHEDMESHDAENHKEEDEVEILAPLPVDADGIFENVQETHEAIYHKASFKFHTGKGVFNIVEAVYDVPNSGFIVTNLQFDEMGNVDGKGKTWGLTHIVSGRNMGRYASKEQAIAVLFGIKDLANWLDITSQEDYSAMSDETRSAIYDTIQKIKSEVQ